MPIALQLAFRQWISRPLRPILCSLAIAAAVALIVCLGAGFESLRYSMNLAIGQMLGVAEVHVRPAQKGTDTRLPDSTLKTLRDRPEIEFAAGRLQSHAGLGTTADRRWFDVIGIDPALDEQLRPKRYASGHGLPTSGGDADNDIIVDTNIADTLHLNVGQQLTMTLDGTTTRPVTIVGIIRKPSIELLAKPTFYTTINALAKALGTDPQYNVIDLKLRDSANISDYDAYSKKLRKDLGPTVLVSPGTNSKAKLDTETRSIQLILTLLGIISAICAALIIGSTLSVGIQERIRQFGQLRCIGASKSQLATFVLGDAFVMLLLGEIFGIAGGFGLSVLVVKLFPQFFLAYKIAPSAFIIALVTGTLATLVGSLAPIIQVTQITPMAAVSSVAKSARRSRVWLAFILGLACILLQILLWACIPNSSVRFYFYMFMGIPLIFGGYVLLGPAAILAVEAVGSSVIGGILRVRPSLLRNAWSQSPWRSGAMIAALMIGVTLLSAVRGRGQSLLASWVSPARLPDLLMYSVVDSLMPSAMLPSPQVRAQSLKTQHPEIAEITAVATFPVKMKTQIFTAGDFLPDPSTNFVAVNPETFTRLVEVQYIQGDPQTALKQLADGQHIFVTDEFYNVRHLGVGDKLTLLAADGKPIDFTIAAVVSSTGMELVKNYFDMRAVFSEQAIASVLGSLDDAHKYFKLRNSSIFLASLKPGTATPDSLNKLRGQLTQDGFQCVSAVELKDALRSIISRVVDTLSLIAIGALAVASLGVTNMVIASVHARRYEFGVLRAIGAGRFQLIRLVLAEVSLLGAIAGLLGTAAGMHLAFMGTLVDRIFTGFPGVFLSPTPSVIATSILSYILISILVTTLLASLASIIPATRAAFTAQRSLLATGRG